MDEGQEVSGTPIEAYSEAAEMLELVETSLDAVATSVDGGVLWDWHLARAGGGDDALGACIGDGLA